MRARTEGRAVERDPHAVGHRDISPVPPVKLSRHCAKGCGDRPFRPLQAAQIRPPGGFSPARCRRPQTEDVAGQQMIEPGTPAVAAAEQGGMVAVAATGIEIRYFHAVVAPAASIAAYQRRTASNMRRTSPIRPRASPCQQRCQPPTGSRTSGPSSSPSRSRAAIGSSQLASTACCQPSQVVRQRVSVTSLARLRGR